MTKINHPNLGEITGTRFVPGVVTEVYSADDTVDITVAGVSYPKVPLFYHCTPNAVQRSNGAMTDAAGAFHTDDVVIAQLLDGVVLRVVGFQSGLKPCESQCACVEDSGVDIIGDWNTVDLSLTGSDLAANNPTYSPTDKWTYSNPSETELLLECTSFTSSWVGCFAHIQYNAPGSYGGYYMIQFKYSHMITGFEMQCAGDLIDPPFNVRAFMWTGMDVVCRGVALLTFYRWVSNTLADGFIGHDCGGMLCEERCICFAFGPLHNFSGLTITFELTSTGSGQIGNATSFGPSWWKFADLKTARIDYASIDPTYFYDVGWFTDYCQ